MKVDMHDTTYMPSLVKVSAGNNFRSLIELAAVSIQPQDTVVTLLKEVQEVYVPEVKNFVKFHKMKRVILSCSITRVLKLPSRCVTVAVSTARFMPFS